MFYLLVFIFNPNIPKGFIAVVVYNRMHELETSEFYDTVKRKDAKLMKQWVSTFIIICVRDSVNCFLLQYVNFVYVCLGCNTYNISTV
jgi:hypothetical protein